MTLITGFGFDGDEIEVFVNGCERKVKTSGCSLCKEVKTCNDCVWRTKHLESAIPCVRTSFYDDISNAKTLNELLTAAHNRGNYMKSIIKENKW